MAISYVLVERGNPRKPDEPKKFHGQARSVGTIDMKGVARRISRDSTTVSDTDAYAVLNEFVKIIPEYLRDGYIVKLGDLGTFQISIGSAGSETEKSFHSSLIRKPKVGFRPGEALKEMLATLKYTKFSQSTKSSPETPPPPPPEGFE